MDRDTVLEMAVLRIVPGQEAAFEAAFAQARLCLDGAQGHVGHSLHRGIEEPGVYLLQIHWQTLEDHTVVFRASPQHAQWKRLLSPFYEDRPQVTHHMPCA